MKKGKVKPRYGLLLINFLVLQWFCIRLARVTENNKFKQYTLLRNIVPLTGWWSEFKFTKIKKKKPKVTIDDYRKSLKSYSKRQLVKELICLSQEINKNEHGVTMEYTEECRKHSKKHLIRAVTILKVYSNPKVRKQMSKEMMKEPSLCQND